MSSWSLLLFMLLSASEFAASWKTCGIRPESNGKIVGGIQSTERWPWLAALLFDGSETCTGSIINRHTILTAAHCLVSEDNQINDVNAYEVRVGNNNLESGIKVTPEKFVTHPNFKMPTHYYDVALIHIKEVLKFNNPNLGPACLPFSLTDKDLDNQDATVIGWGRLEENGQSTTNLREVVVKIVNNEKCKQDYQGTLTDSLPQGISDSMICAALPGRDSCQGDSGGPLMVQADDKYWYQVGITSLGKGCAQPGYPGIYTDVRKMLNWIRKNVKMHQKESG